MQEQLKASAHIPDSFPTAGSVEVFDSASPRAGEPCDLEIGVTLEEDVPAGRSIELWLHFVSDAEILQVEEPRSKNYLRVATSGPDVRTYIDPLQKVHGEGAFFPYRRIAGARLQENARFAAEFMARDIRMAGYTGCASRQTGNTTNTLNSSNQLAYNFTVGDRKSVV